MRKFGASLLLQQNLAPGGCRGEIAEIGELLRLGAPLTGIPAEPYWGACRSSLVVFICLVLPPSSPSPITLPNHGPAARRTDGCPPADRTCMQCPPGAPCPQRPVWAGGGSPDPSPCPLRALATQPQTCFSSGTQRCSPSDALAQESGCSCLTRAPGLLWGRFKEFSETS